MAFLDLFRAKHRHSDPAVRIAAIGALDAATLLQVARRDLHPDVRLETQRYLDLAGILQMACHDPDRRVYLAAGARLSSAQDRAKWVNSRPTPAVLEALGSLPKSQLIDLILAKPKKESALALLRSVHGDANLVRIANSTAMKSVRAQAARRLSDPELIYGVLCSGFSRKAEAALVRKLPHSLVDEKLAHHDEMPERVRNTLERSVALRKLMVTEATVSATCQSCEQPLLVRSVALEHACAYCNQLTVWKPDFWTVDILEQPLRNRDTRTVMASGAHGPRRYEHGHTVRLLACEGCGTEVGETCGEACRECGQSLNLQPVPAWLAKHQSGGRRILYVGASADPSSKKIGTGKPIHMACTECDASMNVNTETPRLMTCESCDARLYVPAEIWFSFHSVPTKSIVRVVWGPSAHA